MKKILLVVLIFAFLLGVGFFTGHRYTAKECAPNGIDFRFTDKFTALISEELSKFNKSNSWCSSIITTINGPVFKITVYGDASIDKEKFKKNIRIRQEIMEKVLSSDNYGGYNEDFEKVRPLAKEIAKKIIEAQPNR